MNNKNIVHFKKKYCLNAILVFIFAGCANFEKQDGLVKIQRQRIAQLEKQLHKKQDQVDKMKVQRWIKKPLASDSKQKLNHLSELVKAQKWVLALKESNRLKANNPHSYKLAVYRYKIFKKMGLNKQAKAEKTVAKKLRAINLSRGSRSIQ